MISDSLDSSSKRDRPGWGSCLPPHNRRRAALAVSASGGDRPCAPSGAQPPSAAARPAPRRRRPALARHRARPSPSSSLPWSVCSGCVAAVAFACALASLFTLATVLFVGSEARVSAKLAAVGAVLPGKLGAVVTSLATARAGAITAVGAVIVALLVPLTLGLIDEYYELRSARTAALALRAARERRQELRRAQMAYEQAEVEASGEDDT